MENKMMEETTKQVSKGGVIVKLAALTVGVGAAVGAVLFHKKKKNNVESEVVVENENQE